MGVTGAGEPSVGGVGTMGETIRRLRRRAGFSQASFGAHIAMHRNYVGVIERGGIPNVGLETLRRLAGGLEVSIAVLASSYDRKRRDEARTTAMRGGRDGGWTAAEGAARLGQAIRVLRLHQQLTQAELAQAADIHRSHFASLEAGEKLNPGIRTIAGIAHALEPLGARSTLLPLFAQAFSGEIAVVDVYATTTAAKPSGPRGARPVPHSGVTP
jgi:transcriptional regulator with XRE-family HTH domain